MDFRLSSTVTGFLHTSLNINGIVLYILGVYEGYSILGYSKTTA